MTANAPTRMAQLRRASLSMLDGLSPSQQRAQGHPELSPMLWHVGHVFFVENYWLAERVFEDRSITDAWRDLYFPEICAKDARAAHLPGAAELSAWAAHVADVNDGYWREAGAHEHALLDRGYLAAFLRQHYAQHLETMRLARAQLERADEPAQPTAVQAQPPTCPMRAVAAHEATIGTETIDAYDNEKPAFSIHMPAFRIATHCVTNAQWLGFMAAGGYADARLWDEAGWRWRCDTHAHHPDHWRAVEGGWHIPADVDADIANAPVHGIGWYEARAFARYAGARLPREVEWEAARRADALPDSGQVWEWCDDAFAPYAGFTAFPYDGYSRCWFDGAHFVARGGSRHTEVEVRRPGFRNFYPPTHRHVFAGLRLAAA